MLVDRLFDVDEFADVELLALASPLTFALGELEFANPLAVDNAPFAVDSPLDTAPFALDVAAPAAPLARFVSPDVSVLPPAEPLTEPALAAAEAEPDPFAMPLACPNPD